MPLKGVILAAGDGGRLLPITLKTPKVLLEVAGRPIIQYPLEALHASGVDNIAVVVGYKSEAIIDHLERGSSEVPTPTFVMNPNYQGENALSLWAAREFVGDDPFILCMGDHIIHPEVISRLLNVPVGTCVLGVDSAAQHSFQINDATFVFTNPSGNVVEIGKDLKTWNAIDMGVFMLNNQVFDSIDYLRHIHGLGVQLSHVVRLATDTSNPFATCDMSGLFWGDVDTRDDYELINRVISRGDGLDL